MSITVYHGTTDIIEAPLCNVGRDNLDFGKGFYLTDIREQAVRWALSVAARRQNQPLLNVYQLDKDKILEEARCKIFEKYDSEWLNFVVANRVGKLDEVYDYVEGGVADDRVIDTVNLYISGLLDADAALVRLSLYKPSNQMCILNQALLNKYLHFYGTERAD
jgi:hypothetical protein